MSDKQTSVSRLQVDTEVKKLRDIPFSAGSPFLEVAALPILLDFFKKCFSHTTYSSSLSGLTERDFTLKTASRSACTFLFS